MQRLLCFPNLYRIGSDVKLVIIFIQLTLLHRNINTLGIGKEPKFWLQISKKESKICEMLSFPLKNIFLLTIFSFFSLCFLNMFLHQQY